MPIEGFDFKEFARNIAEQVQPALPPDIPEADGQYIVNTVHNFCYMAGEAVSNDTASNFTAEQASIVSQFIGEWTYHKAIDAIRSGIDPQYRDGLLQKVAFTVFEIAKTAIIKEMSQGDMIAVVEFHVKKAYNDALEELKNNGVLTEEQCQVAQSRSNIDEMAQAAAQAEAQAQAAGAPPSEGFVQQASDTKILKLATLAIVMKKLPAEKRKAVLSRLPQQDAQMLSDYVNMDGLEDRLDPSLVSKCLGEMKQVLPKPKRVNPKLVNQRLYNIVKNSEISKISNIMIRERQYLREFISDIDQNGNAGLISPLIADIVCKHLEAKLSI